MRTQHIAEANGHTFHFPRLCRQLHHHFVDAFGCTHDICGVHGLVRREHNKPLHAELLCRLNEILRPKDVVVHRLLGRKLHEGDVLVGRGMKHDLRPVMGKHLPQPPGITDRANLGLEMAFPVIHPLEFTFQVIHGIFIDIEHHQQLRGEFHDLPAKLGTDGTAAARYQNHLIRQIAADFLGFQMCFFPGKQVGYFQLPQLKFFRHFADPLNLRKNADSAAVLPQSSATRSIFTL